VRHPFIPFQLNSSTFEGQLPVADEIVRKEMSLRPGAMEANAGQIRCLPPFIAPNSHGTIRR